MSFNDGVVKRADLKLREIFLGLKTNIYEIKEYHHEIVLENFTERFLEIEDYFNNQIRPIAYMIKIKLEKPLNYVKHIRSIDFNNIAYNHEGIFLNYEMFNSLIVSRFPEVNILKCSVEHSNGVISIIEVDENTNNTYIHSIKEFIMDMKVGITDVKVVKIKSNGKPLFYTPNVELACTDKKYLFSKRDSEFWFSKVEGIYTGDFTRNDLFFYDAGKSKCYLDFSVWDNIFINLRSNMLLYDTTYISFPLENNIYKFMEKQNLTKSDLISMVEQNKLVVLLPNTESRYDDEILNELYKHNNNSVISKRGINALIAMYLCEMEKNFISSFGNSVEILFQIYNDLKLSKDNNKNMFAEWLVWPLKAKLASYELLNSYSTLKIPTLGANKLFDYINAEDENSKKISFELTVNASNIHIATALKATYFPFNQRNKDSSIYSDQGVASILGNVLNLYNYSTKDEQQQLNRYSELMIRDVNAIRMIDVDNTVKISKFLDKSAKYNTPKTLKHILCDLEKMKDIERKTRISDFNNVIAELGEEKQSLNEKALHYILSGSGILPGIGTITTIFSLVKDLIGEINKIQEVKRKNLIKKVANIETGGKSDNNFVEEVYILDKLSRIAKLR